MKVRWSFRRFVGPPSSAREGGSTHAAQGVGGGQWIDTHTIGDDLDRGRWESRSALSDTRSHDRVVAGAATPRSPTGREGRRGQPRDRRRSEPQPRRPPSAAAPRPAAAARRSRAGGTALAAARPPVQNTDIRSRWGGESSETRYDRALAVTRARPLAPASRLRQTAPGVRHASRVCASTRRRSCVVCGENDPCFKKKEKA